MKAVLYSTNCVKCKRLEFELRKKEIPFEIEADIEVMKNMGIMSVPQLLVNGKLLDYTEAFTYIHTEAK